MARTGASGTPQTLTGKTLTDTFMGDVYDNLGPNKRATVLSASTDFLAFVSAEVAATNSLEVPSTSSLEISGFYDPSSTIPASQLFNPVKFSVYKAIAQTPASPDIIKFDTKIYDTSNNFDTVSTWVFKAPYAGTYHFNGGLTMAYGGSGNIYSVALYVNGSPSVGIQGLQVLSTGVQTICGTVGGDLLLAKGDTVNVESLGVSTALTTGQQFTYFQGHLISRT